MDSYDRGKGGRFAPGNKGGPGNPHARQVGALRKALLDAVTPEDIQEIILMLVEAAKDGDLAAAREVILRTIGKPVESDLLERLERLEQAVSGEPTPTP